MSTISFFFTIESFPFFKYLLQQSLLKTIYRVTTYYSTRQKKNSQTSKSPHNTIQQGDLCNKKFRSFLPEINIGVSKIYFNGGGFIKFGR